MKEKIKLINRFYSTYKKIHDEFKEKLSDRVVYDEDFHDIDEFTTLFLNRLIVLLFLESEFFLDENSNFLKEKLKKHILENKDFNEFYQKLCFEYAGKSKNERKYEEFEIPHVGGALFLEKKSEKRNNIHIENEDFLKVFEKLKKYKYSLKEKSDCITPEILGFILEKYINQKENGAYYTSYDTTNYISQNIIIGSLINEIITEFDLDFNLENKIKNNENLELYFKEILRMDDAYLEYFFKKIFCYDNLNFSVIDPTCGSGAFIFNVVLILEELIRFALSLIDHKKKMSTNFLKNIKEMSLNSENQDYFILENIVKNNIYGVDLMSEAIETLRLRLYLKFLSEIKNIGDMEKIPDFEKNFKIGNILVGDVLMKTDSNRNYEYEFNWLEEFPEIIKNGGFDCVIGNPPYIEYTKVKKNYEVNNIEYLKTGNLYSFSLERSNQILKENGFLGMIVPISLVSTIRTKDIRKMFLENSEYIFFSNFGDRPGCLFQGVHQKLTIFLSKKRSQTRAKVFTTSYLHWYSATERAELFSKIKYYENNFLSYSDQSLFKIGNQLETSIIEKIMHVKKSLKENFEDKKNEENKESIEMGIYLNMRMAFWVKCFTQKKYSKEYTFFKCKNREVSQILMCVLNSNLFFMFWECVSDNWHITSKELSLFKFDSERMDVEMTKKLSLIATELENDLENKKRYVGTKQTEYEYVHKNSKDIIDKIDLILGDYYGFSNDEIEFIKSYNIAYR